jgi:hypothetical protein
VLGTEEVNGVATTVVGFFGGDARTPVWFPLSIDGTGLVRHARMQAPGHFMKQIFDDFNAPLTISAPPGT